MEYVLLILIGLAIPVAWSAAFFMALGARARLTSLEQRLAGLERWIASGVPQGAPAPRPTQDPALDALARTWVGPAAAAPAEPTAATPTETAEQAPATPEPTVAAEPAAPEAEATRAGEAGAPPIDIVPPGTPPPAPPADGPGLEERLGTRWVVWVGGVALALGAVFLVRYSIEQGLIGPGMRIFLGALFSTALIAAGEWSRRNEAMAGVAALPQASIPAILTAAGTVAAYATVWAAHGLYGFIGPALAFPLLGAVALATLAAALLHGPWLAGLGLVGAYVTPFLIASTVPNFWALYLYLAVVTAAAFALARIRMWRWLAFTALAASTLWLVPGLDSAARDATPHVLYLIAIFALVAALIVSGLLFGPDAEPDAIDEVSSIALGTCLAAGALLVLATDHTPLVLAAFTALTVATVAIAWRTPAATAALPFAAVLAALVIAEWAVQMRWETLVVPGGPLLREAPTRGTAQAGMHLLLGSAFAVLFGGAGFLAQGRSERAVIPLMWAACALIAPVAILIALYYRVAGFERSIPFAAIALLLATLYAIATEMLNKRAPRPGSASATALFAVGAVAALALALTMALEKGWLTVALALMAPGIAMIAEKRPLPLLRWFAAACAALVCLRVLWEPRIVGADLGATLIFNWLLWGYGAPALAFWTAAHLLRRRADDIPARMLDSAAILFTVLTVTLQIRHYVTGGDIYAPVSRLTEVGMQVSALLAIAIGLERVRGRTQSPVHDIGAIIVAGLALLAATTGLLFRWNPLFNYEPIDGLFVNLILLAYGLPALLAITLALIAKNTRPMPYRAVAAASAVVMALAYLTLQVRRVYQGPDLSFLRRTSDPEMWTYSVVWLAFGVLLLLVGILVRSQPARLASAAVILLTVLKVFLYDLSGIGGIWRSFSFIGLGIVLMGIGWLYQRLLFPRRPSKGMPPGYPGATPPEAATAG